MKKTRMLLITGVTLLLTGCNSTPEKKVVERTIYNVRDVAGTSVNNPEVRELLRSSEDLVSVDYNRYIDPNNPDVMYLDGKLVRLDKAPEWITTPNELNNLQSLNRRRLLATDEALVNELKTDLTKEKKLIEFLKGQNELLIKTLAETRKVQAESKTALTETAKLREECTILSTAIANKLAKIEKLRREPPSASAVEVEPVKKPKPKKKSTRPKLNYDNVND